MHGGRALSLAGAVLCIVALLYAILWLQLGLGLEPCPLCVLDRVAFAVAAAVFLVAALHGPLGTARRVYGVLALIPLGFGLAVAGRHLWLQSLPADELPACGPSLDYMLENFPLARVVELVLRGSGSCGNIQWQFLGLSIPGWTFVVFVVLALIALALVVIPTRRLQR